MEKKQNNIVSKIINIFKIIPFIILQVLFIPFMIFGLSIGIYKEMYRSKKLGISFSAGQALQYRWIMHYFDTRPDPISVQFTKKFPCESHFALWSTMGAFIISHKVFGFKSTFTKLVPIGHETLNKIAGNRVLIFDKIIEKHLDNVDQIVLPGAGFDLVAQKYTKDKNIKVFEIDQKNTINMKIDTMRKANIESEWITYIPVDYEVESWSKKLIDSGFDRTKRTLFLWQSVSLYLDENLVIENLKEMKALCNEDSIIALDLYSTAFLDGSISKMATKNMDMIAKQGEPWKFTLNMSHNPKEVIEEFLKKSNLEITKFYQFGKEINVEPFYCIVEAK